MRSSAKVLILAEDGFEVVVDGNIITPRKPDDLPAFCRELIKKFKSGN